MAGRIPREFIDDLISRVDIVELIDSRVPLKKAGREYTACCPFHSEKTPSFTVSPTKQFYYCFGCGAHGTALGFLLEYEHLDFVEAVSQLADQVGMEVPREATEATNRPSSQPLYDILGQSARFYRQQLRGPHAPRAVEYLKGRGLSGEITAEYGIGYAPPGWDNLIKALGGDEAARRHLVTSGMAGERDDRTYDRFRDRVMFPIRDARGRTIAFGGRLIGNDDGPKYLNSPETPIFHKGRELYGLYEVRQALREIPRLLVVEGYMDVVALAQFGIRHAVATLGTSVTADHVEKLFRVSDEVVFCFDGDRAGRDAAWRGLENALPHLRDGRQLRFMFLPDGDDPDTMVRRVGREGFEQAQAAARPLSEFFFDQLTTQTDLGSLDGRARLAELAKPYLTRLPTGTFRQLMIERLASLAGTDPVRMESVLFGAQPSRQPNTPRPRATPAPPTRISSPARHAIAMLLHWPQLAQRHSAPPGLAELPVAGTRLLAEMLELLANHPHLTTAGLLEHWRDAQEGRHLGALALREPLLGEEDDLDGEFRGALQKLERLGKSERRRELEARFRALTPEERLEYQRLLTDRNET